MESFPNRSTLNIVFLRGPQVWPAPESRGGKAGVPERRLRWETAKGLESCIAVAWRRGVNAASRAGPGWQQQAGARLHLRQDSRLAAGCSSRLPCTATSRDHGVCKLCACFTIARDGSGLCIRLFIYLQARAWTMIRRAMPQPGRPWRWSQKLRTRSVQK